MLKAYLEATSGDCGPNGMSSKGDKILLDPVHKDIVQEFLEAQAVWMTEVCFADLLNPPKTVGPALDNFYAKAQKLEDVGIFNNKYQRRTQWKISNYIN